MMIDKTPTKLDIRIDRSKKQNIGSQKGTDNQNGNLIHMGLESAEEMMPTNLNKRMGHDPRNKPMKPQTNGRGPEVGTKSLKP